jgi:lipoprotein-releasing system ATP-binding protein
LHHYTRRIGQQNYYLWRQLELSKVLEINNLSKIYGEGESKVKALDNVSLSIEQGEVVLIVGSSGSGKSTLLNMIGLLDRPTNGKIFIDGIDTTTLNDDKISSFRNKKLGFIFQFSNLLSDLTVLENVLLPRQIAGTNDTAEKDAKDLLKAVGLEDQLYKRTNKISGGQAQRAAIARGLINKPSIVLADEPTGNLDSLTSETIVQLMKSMAKKLNQTFIIVTHDREHFGDVDKVITIKDGKAFKGDKPSEMEIIA